ncbi:MAG: hypothetical protein RR290_00550 [Clostridia bacterium]
MALTSEEWKQVNKELNIKKDEILSRLENVAIDENGRDELKDIISEYDGLQTECMSKLNTLKEFKETKKEIVHTIEDKLTEINKTLNITDANANKSNRVNVENAIAAVTLSNLSDENKSKFITELNDLEFSYKENENNGIEFVERFNEIKDDINASSKVVISTHDSIDEKIKEFRTNNIQLDNVNLEDTNEQAVQYSKADIKPDFKPEIDEEKIIDNSTIDENISKLDNWKVAYISIENRLEATEKGLDTLFSAYGENNKSDSIKEKYDRVLISLDTPEKKAKFKKDFNLAMEKADINKEVLVEDFNTINKNVALILEKIKNNIFKVESEIEQKKEELKKEEEEKIKLEEEKIALNEELLAVDKEIEDLEKEISEDEEICDDVDQTKYYKLNDLQSKQNKLKESIDEKIFNIDDKEKSIKDKNDYIKQKEKESNDYFSEYGKKSIEFQKKSDNLRDNLKNKGVKLNSEKKSQLQKADINFPQPSQTFQETPLTLSEQAAQPAVKQASRNRKNYNYIIGYLGEGERMNKEDAMARFKGEVGGKEFEKMQRALQELNASIIEPSHDEKVYLKKIMLEERNQMNLLTSDSDYAKNFEKLTSSLGISFGKKGFEKFYKESFMDLDQGCGVLNGFSVMGTSCLEKWNKIIETYSKEKENMSEKQINEFEKYIMTPAKFGILHNQSKELCKNSIVKSVNRIKNNYFKKHESIDEDSKLSEKTALNNIRKSIIKIEVPEVKSQEFNDSLKDGVYNLKDVKDRNKEQSRKQEPPLNR